MKIAAIVVTFNRKAMLIDTLSGLLNQSRALDKIYLINNASTDGTHEFLVEKNILNNPVIDYHRLPTNTGGAGGFSYGVNLAYQADYDWIWTMDDDVEPRSNCLETLLKYSTISKCINSTKIFTKNNEVQYWEQYFDFATSRLIDLKNVSFLNGKEWCSSNVACFEGMLVHRDVVEKIGAPDASYFIYHDDTVYGILASFYTNVIYVRDAIFDKKIYGYGDVTPMRSYYSIRNSFWLKQDIFNTGMVGESTIFSNFLFLLNMLRTSIKYLWLKKEFKILKSVYKGWVDGIRGK